MVVHHSSGGNAAAISQPPSFYILINCGNSVDLERSILQAEFLSPMKKLDFFRPSKNSTNSVLSPPLHQMRSLVLYCFLRCRYQGLAHHHRSYHRKAGLFGSVQAQIACSFSTCRICCNHKWPKRILEVEAKGEITRCEVDWELS